MFSLPAVHGQCLEGGNSSSLYGQPFLQSSLFLFCAELDCVRSKFKYIYRASVLCCSAVGSHGTDITFRKMAIAKRLHNDLDF